MREYDRDREFNLYPEWSYIENSSIYSTGYWTICHNHLVYGIPTSNEISIRKVILTQKDHLAYCSGNHSKFNWKHIFIKDKFNTNIDLDSIIMEQML